MTPALRRPLPHTGFTLIEVLLVVLLIGVVSGLVLLAASPSDPTRLVIGEADRLEEAVSLAQDTAVSDNEQLGLMKTEDGYQFLVFDDASAQWLPSDNPAFTPYTLPAEIQLDIQPLESAKPGAEAVLPLQARKKKDALLPQVMLLSSGESTAASLLVSADKVAPEKLVLDDIGNLSRNPEPVAGKAR